MGFCCGGKSKRQTVASPDAPEGTKEPETLNNLSSPSHLDEHKSQLPLKLESVRKPETQILVTPPQTDAPQLAPAFQEEKGYDQQPQPQSLGADFSHTVEPNDQEAQSAVRHQPKALKAGIESDATDGKLHGDGHGSGTPRQTESMSEPINVLEPAPAEAPNSPPSPEVSQSLQAEAKTDEHTLHNETVSAISVSPEIEETSPKLVEFVIRSSGVEGSKPDENVFEAARRKIDSVDGRAPIATSQESNSPLPSPAPNISVVSAHDDSARQEKLMRSLLLGWLELMELIYSDILIADNQECILKSHILSRLLAQDVNLLLSQADPLQNWIQHRGNPGMMMAPLSHSHHSFIVMYRSHTRMQKCM